MSVLVPDLAVYESVYNKALSYTYNKSVDINYCYALGQFNNKELKQIIKDWLWLNEMSYIRRYDEESKPDLEPFLTFKTAYSINTYQMLKHLKCISYNIEIITIKTGKTGFETPFLIPQSKLESFEILNEAIEQIKDRIIDTLPEYQVTTYAKQS